MLFSESAKHANFVLISNAAILDKISGPIDVRIKTVPRFYNFKNRLLSSAVATIVGVSFVSQLMYRSDMMLFYP